jgi:uncharacterized membrane protein
MRQDRFPPHDEAGSAAGIVERIRAAFEAARDLLATRGEILREEIAEKAGLAARGAIGFGLASLLGGITLLLLTALIASLFALLFGSAWAGILATLVLYLAGVAGAAFFGWKALSKLRFDFPATRRGLSEDWNAVAAALKPTAEDTDADMEERFRAGSE